MSDIVKSIILVSVLVLVIDMLWIQWIMKDKYSELIPKIQGSPMNVRYFAALLSYLTIILPIVLFSIPNIRASHRFMDALFYGGILGMCMYGMFSLQTMRLFSAGR